MQCAFCVGTNSDVTIREVITHNLFNIVKGPTAFTWIQSVIIEMYCLEVCVLVLIQQKFFYECYQSVIVTGIFLMLTYCVQRSFLESETLYKILFFQRFYQTVDISVIFLMLTYCLPVRNFIFEAVSKAKSFNKQCFKRYFIIVLTSK